MKKSLLMLALFVSHAHAAPPTPAQLTLMQNMVAQCSGVMGREVCRVEIDGVSFRDRYPNGIIVAGVGRFTADEYGLYALAGDRMCDVIVRQCSVDYDGRGCLMARALWKQR